MSSMEDQFSNMMKNNNSFNAMINQEKRSTLIGLDTIATNFVWSLEPCMAWAVSLDKVKIFAVGIFIAVGTTIAMPFVLASISTIMGAVGAKVGIRFGILAAGLSTAEAFFFFLYLSHCIFIFIYLFYFILFILPY